MSRAQILSVADSTKAKIAIWSGAVRSGKTFVSLFAFFAPYAIALINHPSWAPKYKKLVSILVSILLAAVVMAFYYLLTGDTVESWPVMILLSIIVTQAAYALVLKPSATSVEQRHGTQ